MDPSNTQVKMIVSMVMLWQRDSCLTWRRLSTIHRKIHTDHPTDHPMGIVLTGKKMKKGIRMTSPVVMMMIQLSLMSCTYTGLKRAAVVIDVQSCPPHHLCLTLRAQDLTTTDASWAGAPGSMVGSTNTDRGSSRDPEPPHLPLLRHHLNRPVLSSLPWYPNTKLN